MSEQNTSNPSQWLNISELHAHHFWYPCNLLSSLRLLIAPLIAWSLLTDRIIVLVSFGAVAIISDILDGYFARKFDHQTELGKILDPIADKATFTALFFALMKLDIGVPMWMFLILLTRDFLIIVGSFFLLRKTKFVQRSNWIGKIASFSLSIVLALYISDHFEIIELPQIFLDYSLKVGIILALLSFANYAIHAVMISIKN